MTKQDETRSRRPCRAGYTLVEILTVIAIIVVVAGIILAVFVSSKGRAKEAVEIENLHQLSLSASMYHDQFGEWPLTVATVVTANMAPPSIAVSPLDDTPLGLANQLSTKMRLDCPACEVPHTDYRRTFIGPQDFGHATKSFNEDIEPYPDAGWLVCLTRSKPGRENDPSDRFMNPVGPYLRLLLTGGVVTRFHHGVPSPSGDLYTMQFMFADGDDQWRRRLVAAP